MGTNYYLKSKKCEHCGRGGGEGLHIGKSSAGWCFGLHVYPAGDSHLTDEVLRDVRNAFVGPSIDDLNDWIPLFEAYGIVDEYGRDVSVADMLRNITERSHPNGLLRHPVETGRCLGPGAGTWDRQIGDWS